jgi:hypothetical protein
MIQSPTLYAFTQPIRLATTNKLHRSLTQGSFTQIPASPSKPPTFHPSPNNAQDAEAHPPPSPEECKYPQHAYYDGLPLGSFRPDGCVVSVGSRFKIRFVAGVTKFGWESLSLLQATELN